jgi:hypothetical protein
VDECVALVREEPRERAGHHPTHKLWQLCLISPSPQSLKTEGYVCEVVEGQFGASTQFVARNLVQYNDE